MDFTKPQTPKLMRYFIFFSFPTDKTLWYKNNFFIPSHSNTFSDWRKTWHVQWVKTPKGEQNSLTPSGNNNMNFRLACDQVVLFETTENLWASRRKANDFFAVFLTKHVMTDPVWNSEFCFPRVHCFPWGKLAFNLISKSWTSLKFEQQRQTPSVRHLIWLN